MVKLKYHVGYIIHIYIRSNIVFNNNMIKITDIYVSITVFLLQLIYICWDTKNRQYSMLANYDYKNISIENYKWEALHAFMLVLCLSVTRSSTLVYLQVKYNIKCYIFQRRNTIFKKEEISMSTTDI